MRSPHPGHAHVAHFHPASRVCLQMGEPLHGPLIGSQVVVGSNGMAEEFLRSNGVLSRARIDEGQNREQGGKTAHGSPSNLKGGRIGISAE